MRLTRKQIATRMTARGCQITPEAVGQWRKANKVPADRFAVFVGVLKDECEKNNGVDVGAMEAFNASV